MPTLIETVEETTWASRIKVGMKLAGIKIMQRVAHVNQKQVFFMADNGQSFADTPRAAFELLAADPAYANFTFVWAFEDPAEFNDQRIDKKISTRSWGYMYHLLRSKYWVSNTSVDQLVPFKHPKNVYVQFGEGVPLQHVGIDNKQASKVAVNWSQKVHFDYLFTYGTYDTTLLAHIFPAAERYNQVGQLRKHAIEVKREKFDRLQMMRAMRLNPNKRTLLYVATERPNQMAASHVPYIGKECLATLMQEFNIIYRGVNAKDAASVVPGVVNGNKLDLAELFLLSDVLVTDYSNLLFDYAVERKPIYLYQPDVDAYAQARGLYMTAQELGLPSAQTEKELLHLLLEKQTLEATGVEDVLTYYNPLPAAQSVDFLFEIIPAND